MRSIAIRHLLHRLPDANKYNFGHVLIVGGSPGMVGAPFLAAEASLRVGAGVVTIASEDEVIDKLEKRVKEIMTLSIGAYDIAGVEVIKKVIHSRRVTTVVVGPGMLPANKTFIRHLLASLRLPVVLDAGGLAAFNDDSIALAQLTKQNSNMIITPHTGEFGKLIGSEPASTPAKMKLQAMSYAKKYGITIVLKGQRTLIAYPDGSVHENQTGNTGMATAGAGGRLFWGVAGFLLGKSYGGQ